jgi:hypothetical protein
MSSRLKASCLAPSAALLAAVLALGGCSSDGNEEWLAMFKAARGYWETRDAAVTLDEASSIPYATLGVRIDGSREQVMVLATDTDGERLWASSGGVALSTRNGRIVRTAGFGADLTGYAGEAGRENWFQPHRVSWTGDFADLGYFSVAVVCEVAPAGREPIKILGQEFDTVRIDETCRADKLRWTFSNSYWVSATTGRVWRAVVHFHPKGPELDMEILRPPLSQS